MEDDGGGTCLLICDQNNIKCMSLQMRHVRVSVSFDELLVEFALQPHVGHWNYELRSHTSTQHAKRHIRSEFNLPLHVLR